MFLKTDRAQSVGASLFCAFVYIALTSHALAQTGSTATTESSAAGNSGVLDEVVVTAQRRSERLQDVPISVSAFSAKDLESAGIVSTADLPVLTPGFVFGYQDGLAQPFLRGVGTVAAGPGIENPIAVYVDNVYYGAAIGDILSLSNVSQVEVDKGPQGTLFGRNATGGLIQILTKDPSQTFGGSVAVTYGNYATAGTDFYVTGGITQQLATDFMAHFLHQGDGYGENLLTGAPVAKTQDSSFRNKWLLDTEDGTQLKLILDYDVTHYIPNYTLAPGTTPLGPPSYPVPSQDIVGVYQPFGDTHSGGASFQVKHDLSFAQLVSISAYRRAVAVSQSSAQLTPDTDFSISTIVGERNSQISQEFQLLSLPSSTINWAAGTYLYADNAGFSPPVNVTGALAAPFSYVDIYDIQKAYSAAFYGQATVKVATDTDLTIGARYTVERRDFRGVETVGIPGYGSAAVVDAEHALYKTPTWRVALDHHFTPDLMGYVSYNRGFKSGGFNDDLVPTVAFKPETLDAYELGSKSSFLDGHVSLNAAAFLYHYKNIQAIEYASNGLEFIYNAASARLYGLDLDAKVKVFQYLTLTPAIELLNTEYTSFPNAADSTPIPGGGTAYTTASSKGHELPLAPKVTYSVTADYLVPCGTFGDVTLSSTYAYDDGFFGEPDNRLHQPAYHVVNSQIAWKSYSGVYSVRLWGKNLTNAEYTTSIGSQPNGDFAVFAPPRTYGVTVSTSF